MVQCHAVFQSLFHRCARISTYLFACKHVYRSYVTVVYRAWYTHTRQFTGVLVFRMQVHLRTHVWACMHIRVYCIWIYSRRWSCILRGCSWLKAVRFCSPCHSLSTLVKGLLGESNILQPLRPILRFSPLHPTEWNSRRRFVVSKQFIHELRLLFFYGDEKKRRKQIAAGVQLSFSFLLIHAAKLVLQLCQLCPEWLYSIHEISFSSPGSG